MKIEIDDNNINVEKIMEQIKKEISRREYKNDLVQTLEKGAKTASFNLYQLEEYQSLINRTWNYSANYPISSHRKYIGKLIIFVKKCIRKLLGWYINPLVEKQVEFNANMVQAYNELIIQLRKLEDSNVRK